MKQITPAASANAKLPLLGIPGLPTCITHFELIADGHGPIRIKCEFLAEKETWVSLEEKLAPFFAEYVLVEKVAPQPANKAQAATEPVAGGV